MSATLTQRTDNSEGREAHSLLVLKALNYTRMPGYPSPMGFLLFICCFAFAKPGLATPVQGITRQVATHLQVRLQLMTPLQPSKELTTSLWNEHTDYNGGHALLPSMEHRIAEAVLLHSLEKPAAAAIFSRALTHAANNDPAVIETGAELERLIRQYQRKPLEFKILGDMVSPLSDDLSHFVQEVHAAGAPDKPSQTAREIRPVLDVIFDGREKSPAPEPPYSPSRVLKTHELQKLQPGRGAYSTTLNDDRFTEQEQMASWRAFARGAELVNSWAKADKNVEFRDIVTLNKIVRQGTPESVMTYGPGRIRRGDAGQRVHAHGGEEYVAPDSVISELWNTLKWYHSNTDKLPPVVLATGFYQRLAIIHPFGNGNGRTGRLIMDFILQRNGLVPPLFSRSDHWLSAEAVHASPAELAQNVARGIRAAEKILRKQ